MSIPTNKNIKAVSYNGTNIPLVGGSSTLQEKTVSPSVSAQEVTADAGYDGLSKVTVNAMPSGALSNPTINTSTGVVTAQIGTSGYLASGTNTTLALTTQGSKTVTPSASSQTAVESGRYTTGAVTVAGDENLTAENIKSGVAIFGTTGTFTSDADATASDIASGKTAYVDGVKITGTGGGSVETETKTVALAMEDGDQVIDRTPGKYMTQVTVEKPDTLIPENIKNGVVIGGVSGSYGPMNIKTNQSMVSVRQTALGTTGLSLTVDQTGTYTISWMAARNSSTGTMSTRLYVDGAAQGTDRTTWTNTYAQHVSITGLFLVAGDTVEVYARSGSTSRYIMVGNLIIEQTA